ncbi:ribosome maturation factor RimM [Salinicola rhizosphaerae]|uniref:Ribosome maturation factor RimM n=1 Tax=Salinicola rhizosphaerae TaxID=1443141 RepID=A0ABQ3DX93_9GAMM|nr:ribosome maturation factor RimM [Salinicola rhizosphaerae]GHB16972.1 ribosome maturation factor RimM [Salinicola rhizosphaerae]
MHDDATGDVAMSDGEQHVVLGRLTSPHGVKGWLKIYSYTSPPEGIFDYPTWILSKRGEHHSRRLLDARPQGKGLVVRLEEVDTRELAEQWAGADVLVAKSSLPELEDDDYYWHQLEGLDVQTCDGTWLGRIDHLFETGANDVMVVRPCEGSLDDRERLLPFLPDDVIVEIDLSAKRMVVEWDPEF